jgi:hypothetical protein
LTPPNSTPTLPKSIWRLAQDITLLTPQMCSVMPSVYISIAGLMEAIVRASSRIVSAGIPLILAAFSGVYSITFFFNSSNPSVQDSTYFLSYRFSVMRTFIKALISATSEPTFSGMCTSAKSTISVRRGSITINLAPASTASFTKVEATGCASDILVPTRIIILAFA